MRARRPRVLRGLLCPSGAVRFAACFDCACAFVLPSLPSHCSGRYAAAEVATGLRMSQRSTGASSDVPAQHHCDSWALVLITIRLSIQIHRTLPPRQRQPSFVAYSTGYVRLRLPACHLMALSRAAKPCIALPDSVQISGGEQPPGADERSALCPSSLLQGAVSMSDPSSERS